MTRSRKNMALWALAVVNAVLLTALITRHTPSNQAMAQVDNLPVGEYITIPATISGATNGLVFVLDQSNAQLGGVSFDAATGQLNNIPRIDLAAVFTNARGVAPGPAANPKCGVGAGVGAR